MQDTQADTPTLYEIMGGAERLRALVDRFYDLMQLESEFANIHVMHPVPNDSSRDKLFMFTLASGVLVLYAALMGSTAERTREAGLLRALGATRGQLASAQRIEFVLVGGLSGLLAASGAAALGWALAEYQFKFPWHAEPRVWVAGLVAGAVCALAGGWLGLRGVLKQPPLQTLREA